MWETWVRSLGREDSLEKETATHSSTLAWKSPWTEERDAGYCPWGRKESGMTERLHFTSLLFCRGNQRVLFLPMLEACIKKKFFLSNNMK